MASEKFGLVFGLVDLLVNPGKSGGAPKEETPQNRFFSSFEGFLQKT
jgi:hypothetical protein